MRLLGNETPLYIDLQLGLAAVLIFVAWFFFRPKPQEPQFKSYGQKLKKNQSSLTPKIAKEANLETSQTEPRPHKTGPFQLEGFVGDGRPFEILGVPADANEKIIRAAHRELMKRYHPDLVGRPGSREWKDAQKIAETINRARDELLQKLRK